MSEKQTTREIFWTEFDCEFSGLISPQARNELKGESMLGLKSIPRRGAEVGGLLFGSIEKQPGRCHIQIEEIAPFSIEYRFGPVFRFSEIDDVEFAELLRKRADYPVIGWYRSSVRPQPFPLERDRRTTAKFFPDGSSVMLLCHPKSSGAVGATLCLWDSGENEHRFDFDLGRYSALDSAQITESDTEQTDGHLPREEALQRRGPSVFLPISQNGVDRSGASRPSFGRRTTLSAWQAALLGAFGVAILGGVGWLLSGPPGIGSGRALALFSGSPGSSAASSRTPPSVDLRVSRQGDALRVSWDRQAPEVLRAREAEFTISDGVRGRVLHIGPGELRTGSLVYLPSGEDVYMLLELKGPEGTFSQSVRVVGPGTVLAGSAPVPTYLPPVTPSQAVSPVARPATAGRDQPAAKKVLRALVSAPSITPIAKSELPGLSDPPVNEPLTEATLVSGPVTAVLPDPAPGSNSILSAGSKPEASQGGLHLPTNAAPLAEASRPSASSLVPVQIPPVQTSPAVRQTQSGPAPVQTAPSVPPVEDYHVIPARAIESVQPLIQPREYAQAFGSPGAELEVRVNIDRNGRVTSAELNKSIRIFNPALATAALNAAKKWRFEPASVNGHAVQSDMILTFRFGAAKK